MVKDNRVYVHHILDSIRHIEEFLKQVDEEQFSRSRMWQDAFVREIEIIGEAARHVDENFRKQRPQIPWIDMIGMRNKLIHDYFEVNMPMVWDVVTKDIPALKEALAACLL